MKYWKEIIAGIAVGVVTVIIQALIVYYRGY